jgi:DNA polymerase III epsilon subunit-like protein
VFLLFLDTETSGLKPATDQIIEVGGVIADFDPITLKCRQVDSFESLVALRKTLDPKITRITGITENDLLPADKLPVVQENWANWLEKYDGQIVAIVGHSIAFDLGFLKEEGWFLPQVQSIDTLELSRVVFPDMQAINLEYLAPELKLQIISDSSAHRSLFDSQIDMLLFEKIAQRISEIGFSSELQEIFKQTLLPLDLNFYGDNSNLKFNNGEDKSVPYDAFESQSRSQPELVSKSQNQLLLGLNGEPKNLGLSEYLDLIATDESTTKITELIHQFTSHQIRIFLFQLLTINYLKKVTSSQNFKIHLKFGLTDFWFFQVLFEYLLQDQNKELQNPVLPQLEGIIWQIGAVSDYSLNFGQIVELCEIYKKLMSWDYPNISNQTPISPADSKIKDLTQKVISGHDFLLFSLQPFLQNHKYVFEPLRQIPQEKVVGQKLKSLLESLQNLSNQLQTQPIETTLLSRLNQKIIQSIRHFEYNFNQVLYIYQSGNSLSFTTTKPNFDLPTHFQDLKIKFPTLQFQTSLPQNEWEELAKLSGLTDLKVSFLSTQEEFAFLERVDLDEFLDTKTEQAKTEQKPIILLAGQNSTLKDLKQKLVENQHKNDYLILGETGSATKVNSKLVRNFSGIAVFKLANLEGLLSLPKVPDISEIWLINNPYFFIHPYWKNYWQKVGLQKETVEPEFKKLYLLAQQYQILQKHGVKIGFIRGY